MGVSPHGANSAAVSFAAGVQASAIMPNFLMYEYPHALQEVCNKLMVKPLVPDNSYVELPTEPGIGIEINEVALAEYAYGRHEPRPSGPSRTNENSTRQASRRREGIRAAGATTPMP